MKTDNGSILRVAYELVNAERQDDYGPPAASFARIAVLWSAYLGHSVTAHDVAMLMALLKVSREAHQHKPDNLVDGAAYLALAADMAAMEGGS